MCVRPRNTIFFHAPPAHRVKGGFTDGMKMCALVSMNVVGLPVLQQSHPGTTEERHQRRMMTHLYLHRDSLIYAMIIPMYFERMCAMIHQRRIILTLACWQGGQGLGPGVWSWDSSLFLSPGGCYATPLMRSLRC